MSAPSRAVNLESVTCPACEGTPRLISVGNLRAVWCGCGRKSRWKPNDRLLAINEFVNGIKKGE